MTPEQFRIWYEELGILTYGEIGDDQVLSAFKEILTWKSEGRFISGIGTDEYSIPESEHNYTTTEYWLYLSFLRGCIEYGSSPRGGWLTDLGKRVLTFLQENDYPYYEEY